MPSTRAWVDGRVVPEGEASVSAFDHGLTTGDGVFETLRVYDGVPFALTRHLARLRRSAAGLLFDAPPEAVLRRALDEVVEANGGGDWRLRLTVTAGRGPLGSGRGHGTPTVVAAVAEVEAWPPTEAVAVVPWARNEAGALAGLKTTSYAENVVALAHAHRAGAGEAVFPNTAGRLCEGTGTNVFVVRDGRLVTPPLSSGCLAGITRALVVERCGAAEEDLPLDALAGADEAFLTSSTREVHPIATVDGRPLPAAPGPVTEAVQRTWRALVAADLDPR